MDWIYLKSELFRRMTAAGHTQKSLATAADVHETFVRDILVGRSKSPTIKNLLKVATVLGCTIEDLTVDPRAPTPLPPPPVRAENPPVPELFPNAKPSGFGERNFKVYGAAGASPEGWFNLEEAEVVEYAFWPPELAGVREAFGLYVSGESMVDFGLSEGTLLHIHPRKRPHTGQFVVLVKLSGEAIVKRYEGTRNGSVHLLQSNPRAEIAVAQSEVKALYAVVGATYS
jgi:SOS-response transcriptional repressor LexA